MGTIKSSLLVSLLAVGVVMGAPGHAVAQPAAAAAAAPSSAGGGLTADQAVLKVQAFYDKTTTFKSEFTQEFWAKAYNKKTTSRGKVTFAKPGKMDWVYDEPKDNRIVSDGTQIHIYKPDEKQVIEQTVNKSQYPAALSFLTGQGKLSDHFAFELISGDKMAFPGGYVLAGTPKVANPSAQKVLFYVDAQTWQVRRAMILDQQGNRNRFDFVNPRVNEPVSDGQFKFNLPPGTTVVRP